MTRIRLGLTFAVALVLLGLGVPKASATNDPLWARQYGPTQIGAPIAWQKSTGKGVKVAVVDSGIDVDHPDLKANIDPASYDQSCNDTNPDDDAPGVDARGVANAGHGTHVAGTIAAVANNRIGVAGVAPDVKLIVEKTAASNSSCKSFDLSMIQRSITHALDNGAKVINLSLGETLAQGLPISGVVNGCRQAFNRGALCVIAAGNEGETKSSGYPKDLPALVVTSNDADGHHSFFGQRADTMWGVSAPGEAILSTWPIDDKTHDGYNEIQGTSMAAPHVSGAAAILFGMGMTNRQVAERLVATAGPAQDSGVEGAGIIHVDVAAGFQPSVTTLAGTDNTLPGQQRQAGRVGVAGGNNALITTTTIATTTRSTGPVTDFDEGLTGDDARDINQLRLKEASRNSANKPFNVATPLIGFSILGLIVTLVVAIPRIRSHDTPPVA